MVVRIEVGIFQTLLKLQRFLYIVLSAAHSFSRQEQCEIHCTVTFLTTNGSSEQQHVSPSYSPATTEVWSLFVPGGLEKYVGLCVM